jgi:hypothetical protein
MARKPGGINYVCRRVRGRWKEIKMEIKEMLCNGVYGCM